VDVVVIQHSAPDKLLEAEIHGPAVFFFDKSGVSKTPTFDWDGWKSRLRQRLDTLRVTFPMFQTMVTKELHRGNQLEALAFYQACTLRPLVEVLRMHYDPARYNFHTRYACYYLPPEVVRKLENLFFVTSAEDIQAKRQLAEAWFYEALEQVELG